MFERGATRFKSLKNFFRVLAYRSLALKNFLERKLYRWWSRLNGSPLPAWTVLDFNEHQIPCFCISLIEEPEAAGRRATLTKLARSWAWKVDFWPAVDARAWTVEEYPTWVQLDADTNKALRPGAVGLLCSMKELYEYAYSEGFAHIAILEDDALIHSRPRLEVPEDFDIVFFNNRFLGDRTGLVKGGWGTDGYLVSRNGLQKLLLILDGANQPADLLIRVYIESADYKTHLRHSGKPLLQAYHTGPLVTHDQFYQSFIED